MTARKIVILQKDQKSNRPLLELLEKMGLSTELIFDPKRLLEAVGKKRPDLVFLDLGCPGLNLDEMCKKLKGRKDAEKFFPVLLIANRSQSHLAVQGLKAGADGYLLRPFKPDDATAHIGAVLRIKKLQDELLKKNKQIVRINSYLKATYSKIDKELQLARKLQTSLFPQKLPEMPGVKFAAEHFSSGFVTGDFYDVFRLDETHFGFYIADVIGHGVASALLTVFVKKGIQTKDISGNTYRIIPPEEVLNRLNEDLIAENLSDNPFITICYGTFDISTRKLRYAAGGHPAPILCRKTGVVQLPETKGALLGVFTNEYTSETVDIAVNEKVLVYTDGVEEARGKDGTTGYEAFLKALQRRKDLPAEELLKHLTRDIFPERVRAHLGDDATFLLLEATPLRKK